MEGSFESIIEKAGKMVSMESNESLSCKSWTPIGEFVHLQRNKALETYLNPFKIIAGIKFPFSKRNNCYHM